MSDQNEFDFREFLAAPKANVRGGEKYRQILAVSWAGNTIAAVRLPFECKGLLVLGIRDQLPIGSINLEVEDPYEIIMNFTDRFPPEQFNYILGGGADDPDLITSGENKHPLEGTIAEKVAYGFEASSGEPIQFVERRVVEEWASRSNPDIRILASPFAYPAAIKAHYAAAETALYARANAIHSNGKPFDWGGPNA